MIPLDFEVVGEIVRQLFLKNGHAVAPDIQNLEGAVSIHGDMNTSKKLAIIGLLSVVVLACALLHWRRVKLAEFDRGFRQNLAGTWLWELDNLPPGAHMPLSMRCTNIVAPDGTFIDLSWFRHSDCTNTYRRTGTWLVKNEHLIETIKTSTNPDEVTPHTGAGWIIHADAREFTVQWQNSNNESWKKAIQ